MSGTQYKRLQDLDSTENIDLLDESDSVSSARCGILIFFVAVTCMVLLTIFTPLHSITATPNSPTTTVPTKIEAKPRRRITKWMDYYFTQDESQYLKCSAIMKGDKNAIGIYVNNGRMKLDRERLFEQPMDCPSTRQRVHGDMPPFKPLKRSIAFVRTIYTIYEFQEALLSLSYHPDNTFCFAMDAKSSERLKNSMRTMSDCFENVFVLKKEYMMDSKGHGQDAAHFDCLKMILDRKWDHAIILQNFDLVIKTPSQLSALSEILNYTSIMGFDFGWNTRYNRTADWTPAGIKLFKNETGVPNKILHTKMRVRKSLNEVILSETFVKSIFEKLNINNIINLFNNNTYYGVDEMLVNTLYENYLGLEGQMESNCTKNHNDILSRLTHWNYGPVFNNQCHSKWRRHAICVLGVEYLEELSKSRMVTANKVLATFDFGTIACMREMMKSGKTGKIADVTMLNNFPQFREMQMKINGTYDRNTFEC